MATYVLIHGAWHGAWCWEQVMPLLVAAGHRVFAPDLPGHGNDTTPLFQISLHSYVNVLCQLLDNINEPVILIGHSMAGIVISQVAELRPHKIHKLIYVAAFLPQNGESMMMVASKQAPTRFVKLMRQVAYQNAFYFPLKAMKEFAYHQCSDPLMETIKPRLCVEPLLPCITPVALTDQNYGRLSRDYIECTEDKAILIETQRKLTNEIPCQIYTLACDHSPFYSDPHGLVHCLLA
ncbi:MAG: alpha/beta fold hydrolase [Candidatus Berkiellales bacterium]